MKTIEIILTEIMDELHYEAYPSDIKPPIFAKHIEQLKSDYFPLHMVKSAAMRYVGECLDQLYVESEHGDTEHRQWLKDKFKDFYESIQTCEQR